MELPRTATLAELYLRQGLAGRAREIYRELAEGDDREVAEHARRKLAELGPSAAGRIEALQDLLKRISERRAERAPASEA